MSSALLILTEELPVHPREFGPKLAELLGMISYDVLAAFNRSRLIPLEGLPDAKASQAAALLESLGIPAAAVAESDVPPVAQVFRVHNADVEPDGLNVQTDAAGNMRKLPWDRIAVLSAAAITTTRTKTSKPSTGMLSAPVGPMSGGAHMGLGFPRLRLPRTRKVSETAEVVGLLPLDAPIEIRFPGNAFNFDYLEDRLSISAHDNIRTFSADLLERAGGAKVSPGLAALVETGTRAPEMSDAEFRTYNRWLLYTAGEGR
ncbi:MAG: hypothetical protein ACYTGB_02860 [Planctomycetota bacterium]|jgi:hypothetical protein